jgi:glycosyltransferase involved in cell wall biosynthesis
VLPLPNGCEPPAATRIPPAEARATLGVTNAPNAPLLVHLGVMQQADADFLFDALRKLRARFERVRLALIGNFAGRVPADLVHTVDRVGYVTRERMLLWLAAADVGVVPLRDTVASRGRWPGKINEYLSAGLVTVMPAIGDAAAVVAAADAARVCTATPDAFAVAIESVLTDAEARARMSANALILAAGALSWSSLTQRLLSFYDVWSSDPDAAALIAGGVVGGGYA